MSDDETTPAAAGESNEEAAVTNDQEQEEGAGPEMTEAELRAQFEEHFNAQPMSDVLMQFLISLSNLAYVKMGLSQETEKFKDLSQASLAIDAFKALLDATGPKLDSQDASALAGALASMQMTFAKASAAD